MIFKQWVITGVFAIQNAGTRNLASRQVYFFKPEKMKADVTVHKNCSCIPRETVG